MILNSCSTPSIIGLFIIHIHAPGVYIWQIGIGGIPTLETDWKTVEMTTSASYVMKGLDLGSIIAVRVAAVTPSGTTEFCVPVLKIVN